MGGKETDGYFCLASFPFMCILIKSRWINGLARSRLGWLRHPFINLFKPRRLKHLLILHFAIKPAHGGKDRLLGRLLVARVALGLFFWEGWDVIKENIRISLAPTEPHILLAPQRQ